MNVASLENCKELYELSGWDETDKTWNSFHGDPPEVVFTNRSIGTILHPAYNLGYLLRKLPRSIANGGISFLDLEASLFLQPGGGITWQAGYRVGVAQAQVLATANTPEDAAAKLCIELIKEGVIKI